MPDILPRKKTSKDLNVSEYLAQIAQKLKSAATILATPREKVGKSLKPQAKQAALDFYENDEYFQQMPGKNNVSISLETHKQKHLLLCNFKELYQEFKVKNPIIGIGFSKFASLCPKLCVATGASKNIQYVFAVFTRMLLYYAVHQD